MQNKFFLLIAAELNIKHHQVAAAVKLLDEGNTIPFIARYRKEATNELNEDHLRSIVERITYLRNLEKRKSEIMESIQAQDKLTPELEQAILNATKLQEVEDLYLPFRPKKHTRAQQAKERGLEPLAEILLLQQQTAGTPAEIAAPFINQELGVETTEAALSGAKDIIAEQISDSAEIRALLRQVLWRNCEIASELAVSEEQGKDFWMYKDYREQVSRIAPHRILAINRGEKTAMLKVHLICPHEANIDLISRRIITAQSIFSDLLSEAVADSYKRLIFPSLEREIRSELTANAEKQAIRLFGLNLRQLLMQAPLAGHVVMGLDPGYRTGCKMAIVDATGNVLATNTLYLTHSQQQRDHAEQLLLKYFAEFNVTLISIGNGTASYETEEFVSGLINRNNLAIHYLITNEAGASVYSASKLAQLELPDLDVSLRGAVSIARRIQDPLAELVKIDPKSIGVGQYQHDVDQKGLSSTLASVVESCVNHVGVKLNTASPALLTYVSGINASVAKNIVAWRNENGTFSNRSQLLKVSRLGQNTFTQCAGFLRIENGDNPLDNTPVHPESYPLAEQILQVLGFSLAALQNKQELKDLQHKLNQAEAAELAAQLSAGEPTIRDIISALSKPGRDPREDLPLPLTRKKIVKLTDLVPGSIVKGTVHNVTDFGVFVDIGIKTNGLIHRSELSYKHFRHPLDILSVGDIIDCMILSVDEVRNRIALSLKQVPKTETN